MKARMVKQFLERWGAETIGGVPRCALSSLSLHPLSFSKSFILINALDLGRWVR